MCSQSNWEDVPADGSFPAYSYFTGSIDKSDPDDRHYRLIRLGNDLRAILVHDASADKAAACLTIAVGSLYDPDDVPGLAHFCEHMLSKGSETFPEENDFLSFITSNGGTCNAGTGGSYQDYWFSIKPSLLSQALPRLAAFFHSPLFTPNLTSREIHAVDSENMRNLQNDGRRIIQLGKSLSVPGHPWCKFGTGNYASLTEAARRTVGQNDVSGEKDNDADSGDGGPVGRETRRRLVEWWKQEYCAGRMTLCVIGKEPLDDLTKLVVPLFSPITNRGLGPRPSITSSPWGDSEKGSVVFVKTVKDYHAFSLTFLIPDQTHNFTTQPGQIIAHFVGHEGPGSVCAYLKKKGWLVDLSAGPNRRNREVQSFAVQGKLTKEGYLHYEEVILSIFNYLNLLRDSPLELYHFTEISTMCSISFRFREKSQPHTYASSLAYELAEPFPPKWVLSGARLIREWDERLVKETLDVMLLEKGRVMIMAKKHDASMVGEEVTWNTEKWYGTAYTVKKISDDFIEKTHKPNMNAELFLPRPNLYIPEDLTVERQDISEPAKIPKCIRDTPISTLWYKKDDQFWVPKAHVKLDIRSPLSYVTPRHAVLTRLLTDLLEDDLSEVTYDAQLAGLAYSVSNMRSGLLVSVSGYNDKLGILLDTVLHRLKNLVIKPDRLEVMLEQLQREYENFYLRQPSMLSEHYASCILTPIIWTPKDKLAELPLVSVDDIERHKADLLSKIYLEALITGNIREETAISIIQSVEDKLGARALSPSERPQERSLLLPQNANFILEKQVTDSEELNSSLTYYCEFGDVSDVHLRSILEFITHAIKEPAFSQLRTVEQLGYIVASSMWTFTGSMALVFKIQSLKAPSFLEERVVAFLKQYREILVNLAPEDFESKKDGLIIKMMERVKNLREETGRFWGHVKSGYYDFLQNETDAAAVRGITREDVLNAFDRLILPISPERKKFSVHLVSQNLVLSQDTNPTIVEGAVFIKDEVLFKASLICSPAAVPISVALSPSSKPLSSISRL